MRFHAARVIKDIRGPADPALLTSIAAFVGTKRERNDALNQISDLLPFAIMFVVDEQPPRFGTSPIIQRRGFLFARPARTKSGPYRARAKYRTPRRDHDVIWFIALPRRVEEWYG